VGGTPQVSKTTANDFNDPVIYKVTSGDGETTRDWTVTITKPLPQGKKYLTYNKPVKAYYIEYDGGAIEENRNEDAGRSGYVIEAYENKKWANVQMNGGTTHHCFLTSPLGDYYTTIYGSTEWWEEKVSNGLGDDEWATDGYLYREYPLDRFAALVSQWKTGGGFVWLNGGGFSGLADISKRTDVVMPNNTDVTQYYLRSEKVCDIMCDVYKISTSTFWVDPETGFTLRLEARDEQGNLDESYSYEVTRLVVGAPDWDGEHLHPLPTDIIIQP
jgi:hypothetical protein